MILLALCALVILFLVTGHPALALVAGTLLFGGGLLSERSWFRTTLATVLAAVLMLTVLTILLTVLSWLPLPRL